MAYDTNFYKLYGAYLHEETVRKNHDRIFFHFSKQIQFLVPRVVDLGYGLGEYHTFGVYNEYIGVDVNDTGKGEHVQGDYYKERNILRHLPFLPNVFVSLFSLECCYSIAEKYEFYDFIFREIPSVKYGLVSGFFYENKRAQYQIRETGDIVSYQTIEDPSEHLSPLFWESRTCIHTPSQMFGDDIVEVWKILYRTP